MIQTVESMTQGRAGPAILTGRAAVAEPTPEPREEPGIEPLVVAYLAGEPGAGDRIVASFGGVVRDAITRFLGMRLRSRLDLAEDLTHEVFLALFADEGRKLRTYTGRHGCSFGGWLKVVAVRLTIDRLRREARVVALDDDTPRMLELRRTLRSDAPGPEEAMAGVEAAERVGKALADLGPKDRVLAELHLVRGRPLDEVATALGVTMNAAYVRKSRILDRLRRILGRER